MSLHKNAEASTPIGNSIRGNAAALPRFPHRVPAVVTNPYAFRPKKTIGQIYVNIPDEGCFHVQADGVDPNYLCPGAKSGEQSVLGRVRQVPRSCGGCTQKAVKCLNERYSTPPPNVEQNMKPGCRKCRPGAGGRQIGRSGNTIGNFRPIHSQLV